MGTRINKLYRQKASYLWCSATDKYIIRDEQAERDLVLAQAVREVMRGRLDADGLDLWAEPPDSGDFSLERALLHAVAAVLKAEEETL